MGVQSWVKSVKHTALRDFRMTVEKVEENWQAPILTCCGRSVRKSMNHEHSDQYVGDDCVKCRPKVYELSPHKIVWFL